jgi:ribonucleoside-diphosphate reductase alpha chain
MEAVATSVLMTGDPSLAFLDVINAAHRTPARGLLETTSPGGEVALLPHESCILGSINLAHMLEGPAGAERLAWSRLGETVRHAVRFLDDAIEVTRFPTTALEEAARAVRKVGLGVMGYAELLIRLGLGYGSAEALALGGRLMAFIRTEAERASLGLAEERGVFPAWDESVLAQSGRRLRNATLTAVAATGNLSVIAATTPGIEPLAALTHRRVQQPGAAAVLEVDPLLRRHLEGMGSRGAELLTRILEHGHLGPVPDVPEILRRLFVTARELSTDTHLAVQAAFQSQVDNAVAKLVQLPSEASTDDVTAAFLRARELGLKAVSLSRAEPAVATPRTAMPPAPTEPEPGREPWVQPSGAAVSPDALPPDL